MPTLERDGVELFYVDEGEGDTPLVFIHGWSGNHGDFALQQAYFSQRGRAISVDLRGHGRSSAPKQSYTIGGFADDMIWLLAELGVARPVVVGHSMGGYVTTELASRNPEALAGIVLVDSGVVAAPEIKAFVVECAAGLGGEDHATTARAIVDFLFLEIDDAQTRAAITSEMLSTAQHVMASAWSDFARVWDADAAVSRCALPALYISAKWLTVDLPRLRELYPGPLTVGQTVGAGHFNQVFAPIQVNDMIERWRAIELGI